MSLASDGASPWLWEDDSSMPNWWQDAEQMIHQELSTFGDKVREKLLKVSPNRIILRKNPFLFRIRTVGNARDLAEYVISAYLSSSEETMFGNVLDRIALVVCEAGRDGRKSGIENIDLEYSTPGDVRTIVQVKSGPNWGNSSQKAKMVDSFKKATSVLRQGSSIQVRCVEGICYGKSKTQEMGTHIKVIGISFWEEISAWEGTAAGVLKIVGEYASNGLQGIRGEAVDRMVEYLKNEQVVTSEGNIRWDRLYELTFGD